MMKESFRFRENQSKLSIERSKIWEDLQLYMGKLVFPCSKFGDQKVFLVASSKVEGIDLFER